MTNDRTDSPGTEVVGELYRRIAEGDHDGTRALLADAVRWRQAAAGVPAAGVEITGCEPALEQVIVPLETDWEDFSEEVHDLVGDGATVVATGTYRGTFRATGRPLVAEFCHLWTVRRGRVVAFRQFTDTAAFVTATSVEPGPSEA